MANSEPVDELEWAERQAAARERLWSAGGLIISGITIALVIVRLLTIAHYNLSTAVAILAATPTTTVALGSLLLSAPFVAAMIVSQVGTSAATSSDKRQRSRLWSIYFFGILFLLAFTPWLNLISATIPIFYVITRGAVQNFHKKGPPAAPDRSWLHGSMPSDTELCELRAEYETLERSGIADSRGVLSVEAIRQRNALLSDIIDTGNARLKQIQVASQKGLEGIAWASLAAVTLPFIQNVASNDQPWMQATVIGVNSRPSIVGYILQRDDSWFTVLAEKQRVIVYVKSSDVESITPCSVKPGEDRAVPFARQWNQSSVPTYRTCP